MEKTQQIYSLSVSVEYVTDMKIYTQQVNGSIFLACTHSLSLNESKEQCHRRIDHYQGQTPC